MKKAQWITALFSILLILGSINLYAQRWPADPAGDIAAEKIGVMDGNNVRLQFKNTTELSDWGTGTDPYAHKWPNDFSGGKLTDGIALLVGVRVFIENDSIPVTDPAQIQTRSDLDTLYFCQTSYREEQDRDPTGQVEWNFYPARGYANDDAHDTTPAMSNNPDSWPTAGWPTTGFEKDGAGKWFGRRGFKQNADLECFFVANDAQDQEYLQDDSPVKYYPRPGHKIGDLDPDMSVQVGLPWGGAGIRVAVRGYQWNNELARDIIFWEYAIGNISDYDIPDVALGFWVDSGIGGDGNDELAGTDEVDMVYLWDADGVGQSNLQTASIGYVYLETAGQPHDGIDNDNDGLVDEKRDNQATAIIGPYDGIDNLQAFLDYYNLDEADLHDHCDADEDQDWRDGYDTNANGVYDPDEFAGDDIGLDGMGPNDLGYPGPDTGECNHWPDYTPGQGCEPNFAELDVNESDMMGLGSFRLFPVPAHIPPFTYWFRNDESMWELVGADSIVPYFGSVANLILTFSTGPFRLNKDEEQHISIAELHSFDPIEGFNTTPAESPIHAPQLHRQKMTAQAVMDADYTFEFPFPSTPQSSDIQAAITGQSITISWDKNAEHNTREPLLDNRNDFEGYKLFKQFSLDEAGDLWSKQELLMQCDLKDGITGTVEMSGIEYYLGDDSGLQNEFKDDAIYEGGFYKYTIVAYDYGIHADSIHIPGHYGVSYPPFEAASEVTIKVPFPDAIDFPWEKVSEHIIGAGSVTPQVVNYKQVKSQHKYVVNFHNHIIRALRNINTGVNYVADGLSVYDITDDNRELVFEDMGNRPGSIVEDLTQTEGYSAIKTGDNILTGSFDGIRLNLQSEIIKAEPSSSEWLTGNAPITVTIAMGSSTSDVYYFPWNHHIIFTDNPNAFVSQLKISKNTRIYDENFIRIREGLLAEQSFPFYVRNTTFGDSLDGEPIKLEMVVQDMDLDGQFNMLQDRILVGYMDTRNKWAGTVFVIDLSDANSAEELPKAGDTFSVQFKRPFWSQDSLVFIVDPDGTFIEQNETIPDEMHLSANYPNPFNPKTTIEYAISHRVHATLKIYNILGQHVQTLVDKTHEPGYFKISFKANQLPSGVYFYTLQAGDFIEKRKMMLIR